LTNHNTSDTGPIPQQVANPEPSPGGEKTFQALQLEERNRLQQEDDKAKQAAAAAKQKEEAEKTKRRRNRFSGSSKRSNQAASGNAPNQAAQQPSYHSEGANKHALFTFKEPEGFVPGKQFPFTSPATGIMYLPCALNPAI
jgi:type IV secretory pathway VirB10-like protein